MSLKLTAIIALICCLASSLLTYVVVSNHWQAKWSERDSIDALAQSQVYADAHAKQQKLSEELKHAYEIAKNMQDQREADRIAAADSGKRLHDEIAKYKARANDNPTAISISANAATDRLVLANVLERADEAAGALADYADRNREAVINCNNEYNAPRTSNVMQVKR
jgi:hypothetical protein